MDSQLAVQSSYFQSNSGWHTHNSSIVSALSDAEERSVCAGGIADPTTDMAFITAAQKGSYRITIAT